jgi:septal ring factor EnvC (AmiA/AmiB activator)
MITSKHLLGLAACVLVFAAYLVAADDASDHAQMKKEDAQAHAEHDAWQKLLVKSRVEHRKALAALREIEARILEHEASLEELAGHAAEHEDHIRHHDEEIAAHEKGGKSADHAKLVDAHKQVMKEHAEFGKALTTATDDHDRLIVGLQKLRDQLPKRP